MVDNAIQRRKPQQARSLQRYEYILDVAEDLMLEDGYDAMTTNAIAARAGVSIGSLYQYFSNKDAILFALSERYIERRKALNARLFDEHVVKHLPLPALMDHLFDPVIAFYEENPALTYIYLGTDVSPEMAAAYAALDRESIDHIQKVVQLRAPRLSAGRAELIAVSIKAVIKTLLGLMVNTPDQTRRANLCAEIKQMLQTYMATLIETEKSDTDRHNSN